MFVREVLELIAIAEMLNDTDAACQIKSRARQVVDDYRLSGE